MIPLLFTNRPEFYIFNLNNPGEDLDADIYYLPLEVDTEFFQLPLAEIIGNKDYEQEFFKRDVSIQYRGIAHPKGIIFAHPDMDGYERHEIASEGITFVNYLRALGHDVSCERNRAKVNHKKTLHVYLYSFFAVAELFRIFRGEFLDDIKGMVLSSGNSKISQARRVVAETRGNGIFYEHSILMPKWTITINGVPCNVKIEIVDTCAVQGMTSYAELCKNTGVVLNYKDNFTSEEKSIMPEMYIDRPEDFDNYALGDLYNYDALVGHSEMFKTIYETLGVNDLYEVPRLTIGSTVNTLFTACLTKATGITDLKKLAEFTKHGTFGDLRKRLSHTSLFLAKVDGGRCRNNRPSDVCVKNPIADIDISGCYGEGLRNQIYPIGRPCIIDYPLRSKQNEYLTLRQFLNRYSNELVPGLWKARVSGIDGYTFKYRQDFLISWYPPKDLGKLMKTDTELEGVDWWTEDNVGMTKIFTNEIHLAVITHDFVQWLEHICSAKQRKELLDNLIVNCAMFYPKSKQVFTAEELDNSYRQHKGKNTCEIKDAIKIVIEAECHAWLGVEISTLIVDKLILERKKHPKGEPLNNLYKLCINTIYGDMVSPYFKSGNTCVGDNITARARAMAWYMEKGFNGFQTVTDGCAFELNRVSTPNGIQSITAVSFVPMSNDGKTYNYSPLGGEKWEVVGWEDNKAVIKRGDIKLTSNEAKKLIDELAISHLRNMFPSVDVLSFKTTDVYGNERIGQFSFETKDIYAGASFHGSANYAFFDDKGEIACNDDGEQVSFKMRSYRKGGTKAIILGKNGLEVSDPLYEPAKAFLKAIYNDAEGMERQLPFIHHKILKLSEFKANYEARFKDSPVHPGCTIEIPRLLRECSLAQFTFATKAQWDVWESQANSLRDATGQTYEKQFLKDERLNYQKMVREMEHAISAGEMLINTTVKYKMFTKHKNLLALDKTKALFSYLFGFTASEEELFDNDDE